MTAPRMAMMAAAAAMQRENMRPLRARRRRSLRGTGRGWAGSAVMWLVGGGGVRAAANDEGAGDNVEEQGHDEEDEGDLEECGAVEVGAGLGELVGEEAGHGLGGGEGGGRDLVVVADDHGHSHS